MSVPAPREPRNGERWETIKYAIDSNPRTLRLCLIFVAIASPAVATVITMLMRHTLLRGMHPDQASCAERLNAGAGAAEGEADGRPTPRCVERHGDVRGAQPR
jgi:hypothetical protein